MARDKKPQPKEKTIQNFTVKSLSDPSSGSGTELYLSELLVQGDNIAVS